MSISLNGKTYVVHTPEELLALLAQLQEQK